MAKEKVYRKGVFGSHFSEIEATTAPEALKAIGGDFTVAKRDLFVANTENENSDFAARAAGWAAIVREDTEDLLGVVSSGYGIVQYEKAMAATEDLVADGTAKYSRGFVYGKGERLYLTLTDGQSADIGDGLTVDSFFTLSTAHDGTGAFEIAPTFVRRDTGAVLTFNASGKVWTKHSKNVDGRIGSLRDRISKIKEFFTEFVDLAKKLGTVRVTSAMVEDFVRALVPGDSTRSENIRDRIMAIYAAGSQNTFAAANGSLLGAYLAFVEYCDSDKTVRTSKKIDAASAEVRAALDGEGARQKAEAFANTVELAKKLGII